VAKFRFSRRAEADLLNIGIYTFRTWDEAQTDLYIRQLEDCCQLIADNPARGRPCDEIRPGLRRMEKGKHVVFYRHEPGGILISRILHQRMLPDRQAIDDEDDTPVRRKFPPKGG
jgi:toxin ParE1/3/4